MDDGMREHIAACLAELRDAAATALEKVEAGDTAGAYDEICQYEEAVWWIKDLLDEVDPEIAGRPAGPSDLPPFMQTGGADVSDA